MILCPGIKDWVFIVFGLSAYVCVCATNFNVSDSFINLKPASHHLSSALSSAYVLKGLVNLRKHFFQTPID